MKFTTLLAGALSLAGSIVSAAPVEGAALEARQGNALKASYTDDYMFVRDLGNFIRNRNNKNPDYLIWTSDGCSYSPDEPNGWGFFKACWRHDFGYRNFKDQGRFDSYNKERIDLQFLKDLRAVCDMHSAGQTCYTLAAVYWDAVSKLASKRSPEEAEELFAEYRKMLAELEGQKQ